MRTNIHFLLYLVRFLEWEMFQAKVWRKSVNNNRYFTWGPIYIFLLYLVRFLEWEMFQAKFWRKSKHAFWFSISFFRKSYRLWENVEKYCRAGRGTDDNMAHAHCMLDSQGYKHTLRMCNTYYISTTTMAAWTVWMLRYTYIVVSCIYLC